MNIVGWWLDLESGETLPIVLITTDEDMSEKHYLRLGNFTSPLPSKEYAIETGREYAVAIKLDVRENLQGGPSDPDAYCCGFKVMEIGVLDSLAGMVPLGNRK